MKKILILGAVVTVVGLAAILLHDSGNPQPSTNQGLINQVAELTDGASVPSVPDAAVDVKSSVPEAPENGDVTELSNALIGKRATLENCHDVAITAVTNSGREAVTTTQCDTVLRFDEPYDSMSKIELEALAEIDAAAATVLADRLAQNHGSGVEIVTRLYLHALALSAHPDAFESLYNYVNGGHGVVYTNGELNVEKTADAYVWSRVGNNFGYTTDDMVEVYRTALLERGYQTGELEQVVDHWTTVIADRREAVEQGGVQ
jgi:hypothetical protein